MGQQYRHVVRTRDRRRTFYYYVNTAVLSRRNGHARTAHRRCVDLARRVIHLSMPRICTLRVCADRVVCAQQLKLAFHCHIELLFERGHEPYHHIVWTRNSLRGFYYYVDTSVLSRRNHRARSAQRRCTDLARRVIHSCMPRLIPQGGIYCLCCSILHAGPPSHVVCV